jgi:hypothetical protein
MPTIQDLPNELLLETLSYLDYSDIQNCLQATKILRAIAYHPALDHKLFRSKVVKHKYDTIDIDTIIVHPIFDCAFFTNKTLHENGHVSRCTNEFFHTGTTNVHNRVYKDNFTSPPISYIRLDLDFLENKDKSAITVGQILERHFHQYIKMQDISYLYQSYAFTVRINRTRPESQWEDIDKRVELACKNLRMGLGAIRASRQYFIQTRSNMTAFLGCNDGNEW